MILEAREAVMGPLKRADTTLSTTEMPLWVAAKQGKVLLVDSAIQAAKTDASIDLDAVEPTMDRTPLHYASSHGRTKMVRNLLNAGVDVNRKDHYGRSALQLAAMGGHTAVVRAILAHGANVNVADRWGMSPLAEAENEGHFTIAVLLVHKGAALIPGDIFLTGILLFAADYGYSEVALKLIKAGGKPQEKDKRGMTPYQRAKQAGHERTASIILQYTSVQGSRPPPPVDRRRFSIPEERFECEDEDDEDDDGDEDNEVDEVENKNEEVEEE